MLTLCHLPGLLSWNQDLVFAQSRWEFLIGITLVISGSLYSLSVQASLELSAFSGLKNFALGSVLSLLQHSLSEVTWARHFYPSCPRATHAEGVFNGVALEELAQAGGQLMGQSSQMSFFVQCLKRTCSVQVYADSVYNCFPWVYSGWKKQS